ncbi:MAG: type II toxin-antitoxin system HicA family toxin [Candidatus Riflebacteria bacterium]|nr:type II toxin-antitoxin system HicA family toxin [Candidatus Riflebacteria bacterium]
MNNKQHKTLENIFSKPTKGNIEFKAIESLLIALGAEKMEGNGSRVAFILKELKWEAHRPHPEKEAKRYQVESVRSFLMKLEVKP